MPIMTGIEIVRVHKEYREKLNELQQAMSKLEGFNYTRSVLEEQIEEIKLQLRNLEDTRFQPMEAITIVTSLLGGSDHK